MALFNAGTVYYKLPRSITGKDNSKDDVTYVKDELLLAQQKYEVIEDCIEGQLAVKAKTTKYLRKPNPTDQSPENDQRYKDLLEYAIFSNFLDQTRLGLKGACLLDKPVLVIPDNLKKMVDSIDGSYGISSLADSCLDVTLSYNRAALLTDYPIINGNLSKSKKKDIYPSTCLYRPQQIINWDKKDFYGKSVKSLVVLCEYYDTGLGKFKKDYEPQWRVLGLDDNFEYYVEVWRKDSKGKLYIYQQKSYPVDGKGNRWNEIPLTFLSYSGDRSEIVPPPMYNLAVLNIGHYRNSAGYEDSVFQIGEPTLVTAGLTSGWYETELKGKIRLGSRGGIPLPVGGEAYLLQVQANTMVFEAMKDKEQQMVLLGAKMLQPSNKVKTATEAANDSSEENSILISTANSVSSSIKQSLIWSQKYLTGEVDNKIKFELLTETSFTNMTPNERVQLVQEWYAGLITFNEARYKLMRAGIASENVDKIIPPKPPKTEESQNGKKTKARGTVSAITGKDLKGTENN